MSKRKHATASKHAKVAAKAQRATQAVVKSPKASRLRSVAGGSTEAPPKPHNNSKQEAPLVENPVTALDDCKQRMTDNDSKKGFYFSSAAANVQAYQAKLLEMAQANMKFGFEFAQRLATIRSPVEFLSVISEFSNKRVAMFGKYSIEMAEVSTKWLAA